MNPDRLKFAWARGARIQRWWIRQGWPSGQWIESGSLDNPHATYRIHPDDAHLKYGLLSQVCINLALDHEGVLYETPLVAAAEAFVAHTRFGDKTSPFIELNQTEWSMAYLFFAEYLADKGL